MNNLPHTLDREHQTRKAHRRRTASLIAALIAAIALSVGGCGSSHPHQGSVAVLYAGSLVKLMEAKVGPSFEAATQYRFEGFPGGSKSLAQEIRGKVRQGDVFLSASLAPDEQLEGRANGEWVKWHITFATSPLLIAYNPHSSFAKQLRSRRWWKVVTQPHFELGRTDPKLDPKGVLAVKALRQASAEHHDPALKRLASSSSEVFPEEALLGRLQAGQLDAGFFYAVEAEAASPKLPTISISPIHLSASYTVSILNGAPNPRGAASFVRFLLSGRQRSAIEAAGLGIIRPAVPRGDVPASLRRALGLG